MSVSSILLGIDLGGTQVKGLAITGDGRVVAEETCPTADRGDGAWREQVRSACAALRRRCPQAAAIGLCAPGLAARDERTIASMPGRLAGLEGLVWSEFLGLPAIVLNDAHAALLGELWLGAARGLDNVLMLTLGTGVGGAAVVEGRLLRGQLGRAGHVGHMSLDPGGTPDIVGTPGSLEDAIGDCTVAARSGGRFSSTRELVAAAAAGNVHAQTIWTTSVRALAATLASLINVLDPHTIVLGGGIAAAGEALFAPLRAELDRMEWRIAGMPRVALVASRLGTQSGAIGAAFRARQFVFPTQS
ncbi:MAG: ROK family protein [Opitutaceae bacterium]